MWFRSEASIHSLVPRPSPAPVFDRLQYAKKLQAIKNWSRGSIQATVNIVNKTTQCWELVLG